MTKTDAYTDSLKQIPLFEKMPKKELRVVAGRLSPIDVPAGRTFTCQGESGTDFFVVLSGTAVVSKDGTPQCRIEAGGFFGELALLVDHPRTATVTAETDMTIGVLTRPEFAALVHDSPSIAMAVMEQLAMLAMDEYPLPHTKLVDINLADSATSPAARH
jgi:CRP-like cAMP-binding protein